MTSLLLSALLAASTTMLFVGNSYTFGNGGLWAMVDSIHGSSTGDTLLVLHSTQGGATLQDHWNDPNLRQMLQTQEIDIAIFQEQSCMPVIRPELTYEYGDSLAFSCLANGIEPCFLMTWARMNDPMMLQGLEAAYSRMGAFHGVPVAPCGTGFEISRLTHPEIEIYAGDGAHPSVLGSYLASLIIASTVLQVDISQSDLWHPEAIGSVQAAFLRNSAVEACSTYTQPMEALNR